MSFRSKLLSVFTKKIRDANAGYHSAGTWLKYLAHLAFPFLVFSKIKEHDTSVTNYYTSSIVHIFNRELWRESIMKHLLKRENVGLGYDLFQCRSVSDPTEVRMPVKIKFHIIVPDVWLNICNYKSSNQEIYVSKIKKCDFRVFFFYLITCCCFLFPFLCSNQRDIVCVVWWFTGAWRQCSAIFTTNLTVHNLLAAFNAFEKLNSNLKIINKWQPNLFIYNRSLLC